MNLLLSTKLNLSKYLSNVPVFLRDTKLTGLAIKVNPSGSHKYIVEYRKNGKTRRITLGSTVLMSLQEAREQALNVLANATTVLSTPKRMSLSQLRRGYFSSRELSPASIKDYSILFNYFPYEHSDINSITSSDVMSWYGRGSSIPTTTDKMYRQLKAMFNYALQMSYVLSNPFKIPKASRYRPTIKSSYLEPIEQLPRVWNVLNKRTSITVDIIKLLLMTGLRMNEVFKINVNANFITIDTTKNKTKHVLPLTDTLRSLPMFNVDKCKWTKDIRKTLVSVCNEANVPVMTPHSLRRTCASLAIHLGINVGDVKKLLNHSVAGDITLRVYVIHQPDYLLPTVQKIEDYYKKCLYLS